MLKKGRIAVACLAVATTAYWSFAATNWELQTKVSNAGGTITVRDHAPQSTGISFNNFTTSSPINVTVTANPGYTIGGITENGSAVSVTGTSQSVSFSKAASTQSLIASFVANQFNINTSVSGPGVITASNKVNNGGSAIITAKPNSMNGVITGITVNGTPFTPAGVTFPTASAVSFTIPGITADQTVVASFTGSSVNAGANQIVTANTVATLHGSGSLVPGATYQWTEMSGPAVTLTGATTPTPTFTPTASGVYMFQLAELDVTGKTLATSSTNVSVSAGSVLSYEKSACNGCHNQTGGVYPSSAYGNWSSSYHKSAGVTCVSCHTDAAMPTPVNTTSVSAMGFFTISSASAGTKGANFCANCHSAAPANLPVIADAMGTVHSQQAGGASNCVKCHGDAHNAKNDPQAICGQCHAAQANDFFVTSPHWNNLRNNGDRAVAGDGLGGCATNVCHFKPTTNAKAACAACHSTGGANNGGDHAAPSGSLHNPLVALNADPTVNIMQDTCWACHEGAYHGAPTASYKKSSHYVGSLDPNSASGGEMVACQDCHNPHSTQAAFTQYDATTYTMTGSGACDGCHSANGPGPDPGASAFVNSSTGTIFAPHVTGKLLSQTPVAVSSLHAVSANKGWYTASSRSVYINISSQFITPNNTCSDCHGHNNQVNGEYAGTMHADPYGRWKSVDGFKFAGYSAATATTYTPATVSTDGCVRCHTTSGFVNYVQSGYQDLRAWGYQNLNDATGEVVNCRACHVTGKGAIQGEATVGLPEGNVNGWNPASIRASGAPYTAYYNYSVANVRKFVTAASYRDFKESNVCVPCHSGRNGATNGSAINQLANFANFTTLGILPANPKTGINLVPSAPHGVYQAAILDGKFGYRNAGFTTYTAAANGHAFIGVGGVVATNTVTGPCVACHMPETSDGSGAATTHKRHSFAIRNADGSVPTICQSCHSSNFNAASLDAAKANFQAAVSALGEILANPTLNKYGVAVLYYNPSIPGLYGAPAAPGYQPVMPTASRLVAASLTPAQNADLVGAVYNFNLLWNLAYGTTDVGAYAHNPQYIKELTSDTISLVMAPSAGSVAGAIAAIPTAATGSVATKDGTAGFTATQVAAATNALNNPNNHYAASVTGYKVQYMAGASTCTSCHNPNEDALQAAARVAWSESAHGSTTGAAWTPGPGHLWRSAGDAKDFSVSIPANDCQRCHTVDGYVQFTGSNFTNITPVDTAANANVNSPLNCNACHSNSNFDRRSIPAVSTFYNISTVDKVSGQTVKAHIPANFPDDGESNLCISCHSGRVSGSALATAVNNGLTLSNTGFQNSHYLGAAGIVFKTVGFQYYSSSAKYANPADTSTVYYEHDLIGKGDTYSNADGVSAPGTGTGGACVGCHMYNPNATVPNHSLQIFSKDANGAVTAITNSICVGCHMTGGDPGALDFSNLSNVNAQITGSTASLGALQALLQSKGIYYNSNKYPYFYTSSALATATSDWTLGTNNNTIGKNNMGAAFNLNLLSKEPGNFAHNRYYTKRLIFDAIDWLQNGSLTGTINVSAIPNGVSDGQGGTTPTFDATAVSSYLGSTRP